jgi:hypothetical protein
MLEKIWSALKNPKVQKLIVIVAVVILAIYVLRKVFTVGALNQAVVTAQAGSNISAERRYELGQTADALYASMDGVGTWESDWLKNMKKVQNDNEYIYLVSAFGEKEGSTLAEWIGSEWTITDSMINEVNDYYSSLGMTSRV